MIADSIELLDSASPLWTCEYTVMLLDTCAAPWSRFQGVYPNNDYTPETYAMLKDRLAPCGSWAASGDRKNHGDLECAHL